MVQEIQVSWDEDEFENDATVREGQVSIISTYESGQAKQVAPLEFPKLNWPFSGPSTSNVLLSSKMPGMVADWWQTSLR